MVGCVGFFLNLEAPTAVLGSSLSFVWFFGVRGAALQIAQSVAHVLLDVHVWRVAERILKRRTSPTGGDGLTARR